MTRMIFRTKPGTKYKSKPSVVDGILFPSFAEGKRYSELKVLAAAGVINELRRQPRYPLYVNGILLRTYVADFEYREGTTRVTEDVKGFPTPESLIKMDLFRILYPNLELRIIGKPIKSRIASRHGLAAEQP